MIRCAAAVVLVLWCAGAAAGQTADERAAARDFVKKRGDAVVLVTATLKVRATIGGQEQTVDQSVQTPATILDGTGLAVLALSGVQPDDAMSRSLSLRAPPGTKIDVTSVPSEIKMHIAGGRELLAKLVLRDQDLDLAFIRPSEPLTSPLTAIDGPTAKPMLLDPLLVIQRTSESTGWNAAASFGSVQLIIDRPRTYYQLSGPVLLGAPIFDVGGRFVGVTVMRNPGARGAPASVGVLPADDIRETAKQAK